MSQTEAERLRESEDVFFTRILRTVTSNEVPGMEAWNIDNAANMLRLMKAKAVAVDAWMAVYDAYHKASDIYNARVIFIREQEKAGRLGEFHAHGEYKMLNEAQKATYTANETLHAALRALTATADR